MDATRRAVVIGTGAGGLAAAGHLARFGFDVTAVEQGHQLGGSLAPFERQGFVFDVGVHYVGQCRPGQLTYEQLAELGLDASVLFSELEPDGFDIYRFPDFEVRNGAGLERFHSRLQALFPSEEAGLAAVFESLTRVRDLMRLGTRPRGRRPHALDLSPLRAVPTLWRWNRRTWGDFLHHHVKDERARAALSAMCGDWGLPPGRVAALAALAVIAEYSDGAFFPKGGGGALLAALVDAIRGRGVTLRTHAAARRILVSRGEVTGVELEDGEAPRGGRRRVRRGSHGDAGPARRARAPALEAPRARGPHRALAGNGHRLPGPAPRPARAWNECREPVELPVHGHRRPVRAAGPGRAAARAAPLPLVQFTQGHDGGPGAARVLDAGGADVRPRGDVRAVGLPASGRARGGLPRAQGATGGPDAARGGGALPGARRGRRRARGGHAPHLARLAARTAWRPLWARDDAGAGGPLPHAHAGGGPLPGGPGVLSMGLTPVLLSGKLAAHAAERFTERRGRLRHHLGEGRTWHSETEAPPV